LGTLVASLAGWVKLSVLVAAIHWQLRRGLKPLIITLSIYVPMALVSSVMSGFSPVSTNLVIPVVLVAAGFNRVNSISFIKIGAAVIVLANLMFAWMASRGEIRKGHLDQYSVPDRVAILLGLLKANLSFANLNAFSTQTLLFERIDMSELLARQVEFQPDVQPYRYGGTLVDGMYALVPRLLWPSKPRVAGGSEFVSRYTGIVRQETDETSIGVPVQLELYANGGPLWVFGGFFLLALACARVERLVLFESPRLTVLLPSMMALMAFGEGIQQIMLVSASVGLGAGGLYLLAGFIEKSAAPYCRRLVGAQTSRAASPAIRSGPARGASAGRR